MKDTAYTREITIADASCRFACETGGLRPQFGYVELRARSTVGTNGHWAVVVRREPSGDHLPEGVSILVPETVLRQAAPALRKADSKGKTGGIVARTEADEHGTYEAKLLVPGLGIDVSWTVPGSMQLPDLGKILTPAELVGSPCGLLRLNFGYLAEIGRAAKEAQNGGVVTGVSILPTGKGPEAPRRSMVVLSGPRNWYAVLIPLVDGPETVESELASVRADYATVRASLFPLEATAPQSEARPEPAAAPEPTSPDASPAEPETRPEPAPKARRAASPRPRAPRKPRAAAASPAPAPVAPPPPPVHDGGVTVSRWAM